jgi:replicative DNA helicase
LSTAYDERAEQSVIGALLTNPGCIGDLGGIKAVHFWKPAHALLFDAIQNMYLDGEKIDAVTVFAKLRQDKELSRVGGAPYLSDLLQAYKSVANVGAYAQIVMDQYKIRTVQQLGVRLQAINTDVDEIPLILEEARGFLDEFDDEAEEHVLNFHELYAAWTEAQDDDRPAIETPWVEMNDRLSGGLHRQRLYVVGARPGCGKTIMGAQMALYAALSHHKSLIFSLELSREDLMGHILACGARVPYSEITRKRMSADTMASINRWVGASAEMKLEVDDTPDHTIETIAQACRIKKHREGLDFVFIDYLQLIEQSKGENRVTAVDHMAAKARQIARKLDCVVVVAAQLNRKIEDNGGKPRLPTKSDFRESGGIEQTADAAIVLSRPVDENGEEADKMPMMNVTLVKNRTGQEGTFQLGERFDQARFQ